MSQKARDYVPSNDAEFDNWFRNIIEYVAQKTDKDNPEWTHIPREAINALEAAYADWRKYYEPALQPHTPAVTAEKNNARKRGGKAARWENGRGIKGPWSDIHSAVVP